jgi:biotin carboxylase
MEECILGNTLMIVGAGIEQMPAYEAAKKRGLVVVGSDVNSHAPAFAHADHKLIVSTRDVGATVAKAVEFHREHAIEGVMTIANDVPLTVASVAHELGLPSIDLDAAECASDKLLMKQRFKARNVACPWFTGVADAQQLKEVIARSVGETFVLKPVDGRGARGVLLVEDGIDLEWAFAEAQRWGDSGRLILEKFVSGMQLSTESFLLDERCYTAAIAERNYARLQQFKPNIIEDGGTIPPLLDGRLGAKIDDLILSGAAAIGVTSGVIKGDLVIDSKGNPLIIELAPRLSGGWLATHQIPAASGVNLVDAVISYSLGKNVTPSQLMPKYHRATAIRYWFPPPGVIKSICGEDSLRNTPGLLTYGFFRREGDIQPPIRMHPDRFGYVIVTGKDRDEVLTRVNRALSSVQIEVAS